MKRLIIAVCALAALFALGSCTLKTVKVDETAASGYDYILDNMKVSSGVWSNNWATAFDEARKDFVPVVSSRKYDNLEIYLGEIHARDLVFDVAKDDDNVYFEMYMVYTDSSGADVARLLTGADKGLIFTVSRAGWNVRLDFDNMPPTTKALKIKIQKGRENKYVDARFDA
ncbi:MAG: hypothetical protein NT080_08670 [Spirochaetes bacterium]|nr:hypothetical protein [Spirochaetota bacterium]